MIKLRNLNINDLTVYKKWKLPHHKYHKFNGPYFEKKSVAEIEKFIKSLKKDLINKNPVLENKKIISNAKNEIIGEVNWYWKSRETNWLEIGIVIFDEAYWNKGIGFEALSLWIEELFKTKKDIIRLGLSTWSGNFGMIKLAEKLGMKKEAEYRKARIVNGAYFDSVSYGILREEWEHLHNN